MAVFALIAIRLGVGWTYAQRLFLKMWSNDLTFQDRNRSGDAFANDISSMETFMNAINDNISGEKAVKVASLIRKGHPA